ncbi:MAG: thiol:disulfide interchange protein DsbA/DsbL [Steroidobacteraceae bacterium]
MKTIAILTLACIWSAVPALALAADPVQGVNYFLIDPPQPYQTVPSGKIEVTEVFSYACPACNNFYPYMDQFRQKLPRNVVLDYVHASFSPAEDWPMFQRAYFTAQILGVDQRAHDAMFDAVWKSGQLAVVDEQSGRIRSPAPTIEDAARFYARTTGVNQQLFLQTAMSFGVDVKIRQAESVMRAWQIDQTPTMIVDGKYRITLQSAGGDQQLLDVTRWVIAHESKQP